MRCAVFGCGNNNNNKSSENIWRFFHFPKDEALAKKWHYFCRRKDEVNLKTACICQVHCAPEDFEINLGFCKKNPTKLLPSAFPTMYVDSLRGTDKRQKRIDARSRKQGVECLLSESSGQIKEIQAENISVEIETGQAPVADDKDEEIQRLEMEIMQGSILDVSMENVLAGQWMSWCRLCAKSFENYVNITESLTGYSSGPYTDIAAAMADFLHTQIKQDEKLPQQVCEKCHQDLIASLKFRNRAIKVQQMYYSLINRDYESKMNLKMFFEKFDLTDLASIWENRALVKISASDETLAHTVLMEDCNEDISMTVDVEDVYEDPTGDEEELKSTSRTKKVLYKKLENVTRKKYKKITKASEQTKYTCKTCSKIFKRGRNFDNHMKNVHGEDSEMKTELMPACALDDEPKAFLCRHSGKKLEGEENPLQISMDYILASPWMSWCRLCAKSIEENYVNITEPQIGDSNCPYTDITAAITDFLQTQINRDEKLPQKVCEKCHQELVTGLKFRNRAIKVQQMYDFLLNSDVGSNPNTTFLFESFDLIDNAAGSDKQSLEKVFIYDEPYHDENTTLLGDSISREMEIDIPLSEYEKSDNCNEFLKDGEVIKSSSQTKEASVNIHPGNNKKKLQNVRRKHNKKLSEANPNKFFCNTCSKYFKHKGILKAHMKNIHGEDATNQAELLPESCLNVQPKAFRCKHCDQKLESKEMLTQHFKNAHQDIYAPVIVCEACGQTFPTRRHLKDHKITHIEARPFECKICGMAFKLAHLLRRHLEVHEEKHVCNICGKVLSTRTTLKTHLLIHSDSKPHKCDYCGRAFKLAKSLKVHLLAHTGLRPFKCNFCVKTFSVSAACRAHKKQVHPLELAAMDKEGNKSFTKNVPKIAALKALVKSGENLKPLRGRN